MDNDKMVTSDKITKTIRENAKGGITSIVAIYFLMQMNEKMDMQALEIKEMTKEQSEMKAVVYQMRGEVTNLWVKYNEAMIGKEALSKEGTVSYMKIMERINQLENKTFSRHREDDK